MMTAEERGIDLSLQDPQLFAKAIRSFNAKG